MVSYSGVIGLDKILAPMLLVLSLYLNRTMETARLNRIAVYVLIAFALIFVKNISFLFDTAVLRELIWTDLIRAGYFIVPLLYISDMKSFHRAAWLITAVAIIGLVSAFLVAIGVLTLPVDRFEISRIGVEGIRKSIGIFTAYGDLAQFAAFAIVWVILVPGVRNSKSRKWVFLRFAMLIVFVLGLIGAQSRNVLMSGMLALVIYWLLKKLVRSGADTRIMASMLVGIVSVTILSFTIFFSTSVVDGLSNVGGGLAKSTAAARLDQYAVGWDVIKSSPLLGISAEEYIATRGYVNHIHNMWIRIAAIGGIFSALILATLLVRIFRLLRQSAYVSGKQKETVVVTCYFGVMLFSSLFYGGMTELFWVLLGVATSLTCIKPYGLPNRSTKRAGR